MWSPDTTAAEVLAAVDLTGRHAVVTGGYRGVGAALATALVGRGCHVMIIGPDVERGLSFVAGLGSLARFLPLDLGDLAGVVRAGERLAAEREPLDLMINNAAVMAVPEDPAGGIERHLRVNHLGHMALLEALRPQLSATARVVCVTSESAGLAPFDFDDPNFEHHPYDAVTAYGQSKTAVLLYAAGLDRRFRTQFPGGESPRAVAASPGLTKTDLGRYLTRDTLKSLIRRLPRGHGPVTPRTPEQGAATLAYAATAAEPIAGPQTSYCVDLATEPWPPLAADPADAERLWALSEELLPTTTGAGAAG